MMKRYLYGAKKIFKIVFINLIVLTLLLTIIDHFFKTKTNIELRRSVILREYSPNINEYHTPPDYYLLETENLTAKPYRLRTNKNAFIVGEDEDMNADSADILFFGGSTTECLYVDEDQRFPYLVGEKLKKNNPTTKLITLNGGTSGNCSTHSTINLLAKGIQMSPKIVVLMHNINDLELLLKTGDYYKGPPQRTFIIEEKTHPLGLKQRFSNLTYASADLLIPNISRLAKTTLESQPRTKNISDEWAGYRDSLFSYDIIESKFERSVVSFIRLAKSQDIEVVLMTLFSRLNPEDEFIRKIYNSKQGKQENYLDYDTLCSYFDNLNQKIREIAVQENLLLIDLAKEIPADSTHLYDMVHLNTDGSILAASIIAEQLQIRYFSTKSR